MTDGSTPDSPIAAEIKRRVGPLLAPLVPGPCGIDAKFEPAHEDVRSEVAKLEAPGGAPVNWSRVSLRGGELLTSTSKDLVIAAYVAHALYEDEGVSGLAIALTLINELMERYWEPMFPPPARMRARSAAVGWWVEKTGNRMSSQLATMQAPSAELLALLEAETARLASAVRARMGDAAPAIGPLQRALERLRLEAPAATSASASPGVAPSAMPAPAPPPPGPAAVATPALAAPLVPEATVEQPSTVAAPASEAELDQALRTRAAEWLAPIRADAPSGDDARYDDGYVLIRDIIKRLDMPSAGPVDWQQVLREGSSILKAHSKDLLIAAHVAYALYETNKLDGLITGLSLLQGLMEGFWDGLYPDQRRGTRARGSALGWLLARLDRVSDHPLTPAEAALFPQLERAVVRLELQADKLAEHRPAFTPLRSALHRLALAAEVLREAAQGKPAAPLAAAAGGPTAPAEAAQPSAPAAPPAAAARAPAANVSAPVPNDLGPAPSVTNRAAVNLFFTRLSGQLWDVATALQAASSRDPLPYRLSRIASYLTLVEPLPHTNLVTPLPPPSPFIASEIEALAAQQQWEKVVTVAEGSLSMSPFLLDLHRHVHAALGQLGEGHRAAQLAVEGELSSLLRRFPELPSLKFQDGSPFAHEATQIFLSGLICTGGPAGGQAGAPPTLPVEELDAVRSMVASGRTDQALDAFPALLGRIAQGRDRFHARLAIARACASAGSDSMAVALFEGLVADLDRYNLDEWEPALASDCLAGYHECLKGLAARDKEMAQAAAVVYRRLCRVDPKRALSESVRR